MTECERTPTQLNKKLLMNIKLNNLNVVKHLIGQGADICFNNYKALELAISSSDLYIVEYILKEILDKDWKANLNDKEFLNIRKSVEYSGNSELMCLFKARGANFDEYDKSVAYDKAKEMIRQVYKN